MQSKKKKQSGEKTAIKCAQLLLAQRFFRPSSNLKIVKINWQCDLSLMYIWN